MPARNLTPYSEEVLVASAARSASGDSGIWEGFSNVQTLRAELRVTAASGTTPNLTVFIEDTLDGTNWNQVVAFAAKTAAGVEVLNVTTPFADRIRVRWAVTGTTPSFTFAVRAACRAPQV